MSTTAAPVTVDLTQTPAVPIGRLVRVELRKSLDTRAGRWFAGTIVVLVLAVQVIYALVAPDDSKDFGDFLGIGGAVLGYFLPILIILLVTSEASQRTGLVTFTLEPRRSRVVEAKLAAGLLLAASMIVLAALMAVLGTVLGMVSGASPAWSVDANLVFNGFVLANVISVLTGFAIATLIMNTPAAIVGYFVYSLILPGAVGILSTFSSGFEKFAPWVEFNTAQAPLFTGDYTPTGQQWAQFTTAGLLWLALPLFLGIQRLMRTEFK